MPEIPRKPVTPAHMIQRYLDRITKDVDQNVIPVSTGIYSEQSLIAKLKNLPKPILQDYDDKIFFQISSDNQQTPQQIFSDKSQCSRCNIKHFQNKQQFTSCQFCGQVICNECLHPRMRLHPLDSNPLGQRHRICIECDTKYLSLQLSHPYMENMTLIEYSIMKVTEELEVIQRKVDNFIDEKESKQSKLRQLKVKISLQRKSNKEMSRELNQLNEQIQSQQYKQQQLQNCLKTLKQKKTKEQQTNDNLLIQDSNYKDKNQQIIEQQKNTQFQSYFVQQSNEQPISCQQKYNNEFIQQQQSFNIKKIDKQQQKDSFSKSQQGKQERDEQSEKHQIQSSVNQSSFYNPILGDHKGPNSEKLQNSFVYNNYSNYFADTTNASLLQISPQQYQTNDHQQNPHNDENSLDIKRQQIIKAAFMNPNKRYLDQDAQQIQENEVKVGNKCKCMIF